MAWNENIDPIHTICSSGAYRRRLANALGIAGMHLALCGELGSKMFAYHGVVMLQHSHMRAIKHTYCCTTSKAPGVSKVSLQ